MALTLKNIANKIGELFNQGVSNFQGNVSAIANPQTRSTWFQGFTPPLQGPIGQGIRNVQAMARPTVFPTLARSVTPQMPQQLRQPISNLQQNLKLFTNPQTVGTMLKGFIPSQALNIKEDLFGESGVNKTREFLESKTPKGKIAQWLYKQIVYNPKERYFSKGMIGDVNRIALAEKQYKNKLISKKQLEDIKVGAMINPIFAVSMGIKEKPPVQGGVITKIKPEVPVKLPKNIQEQIQQSTASELGTIPTSLEANKKPLFVIKSGQKLPQAPGGTSGEIIPQEKYAYNVNLEKLNLKPEEKANLKKTIDIATPELQKFKGKTLSNEEVVKAAKTSEILQKTTTRDATLQAEAALLKARQQMVSLDKEVAQLAKSGNTPQLRAKLTELVDTLKVVSSNAGEKGRQLQALSINAGDESLRQQILKDILKTETDSNKVIEGAMKVNWDNANEVSKFYRAFVKPSVGQIIDEYRYNNMLSNPRTHLRNAFSNLVQTFLTRPATIAMKGDIKGVGQYYTGALKSFPEAVEAFVKSFKGETPIAKPDLQYISTHKLPRFMTIPTRAMEAADKFFSALIKGGEMARGATEQEAIKTAEYSLFRQGLKPEGQGKLLNGIDSLTNWMYKAPKAVRWFAPFIRTPMNFAKQWIEYSPLGVGTLPGAVNKQEQLAKAMIGSIVTAVGAKVALDGRTTWSAPTDPKQKEAFYATGRKPFSVMIGNKWVSMQYLGPFGLALAIPAAFKYQYDESRTALTDDQITKAAQSLMGMAEYFSGQTFLEGINNFVKLASGDVDYTLPKNLAYTTGQVIPLEGLVRYVSTIIDNVYRKPKGFMQQLQGNIPFASKQLPNYTMPFGEPSTRERINLATPYDITTNRPEYEQMYQERGQKLQQNAVINKMKTDYEQGTPTTSQTGTGNLEMDKAKLKYSNQDTMLSRNYFLYKDGDTIKKIDFLFQPKEPTLTGNTELDKKSVSKYKGEITKKANDIYTLYEKGFYTSDQAEAELAKLKTISDKLKAPAKPKKVTFKITKPPKLKTIKLKLGKPKKLKKIKLPVIKEPKKVKLSLTKGIKRI